MVTTLIPACATVDRADESPEQKHERPTVIEDYEHLGKDAARQLDVGTIKGLIEDLDSDTAAKRDAAIRQLKTNFDLDSSYKPTLAGTKRERATKRWRAYAANLDRAIKVEIPRILEQQTRHNRNHRALAAMYLGESAPHPAFLPLLRAIINNGQENHYTRYQALTALTQIPHDGMIETLIEQLDTDLAGREVLSNLVYGHLIRRRPFSGHR